MLITFRGMVVGLRDYQGKKGQVYNFEVVAKGKSRSEMINVGLPEGMGPDKAQELINKTLNFEADLSFYDGRAMFNATKIEQVAVQSIAAVGGKH